MIKSSRFWWLQGAILFAAVVGCNRNCTNGGGGCAPGMNNSPYSAAPAGAPIGGAGAGMYSQGGATQGFPSSSGMPATSSAFPSSANGGGYTMPGMSSSVPQGLGSTRP